MTGMSLEPLKPPVWVDTKLTLERAAAHFASEPRISVDTEANSLHAYREQVCLIQFSTPDTDYLIDPIALTDLSILAPLFSNPNIEKVFHAAEYDLIGLRRDFGFTLANLFDTMQAARILGYPCVGLDRLLGEKFGIKIDKRHQKADWAARPLKPDQIHYARLDTHYLFDLRDLLEKELREKNHWELACEDFSRACGPDEPKEKTNGGAYWKRFSARKDMSTRELTILNELCLARNAIASRMNRPPFKVVGNDKLIEMARYTPVHEVDLAGIGLSSRQISLWGADMLKAVQRGVEAPLVTRDQIKRPNEAMLKRLDKLKKWRKSVAEEVGVESDVILPKIYLTMLA
ncbi:MAG: ribonuclease D, partial [Anaerolineales bacterium]|nr:ribonuclease D [Anaerolineales bacterium]